MNDKIPMIWAKNQTHDNKTRCSCCDRIIRGEPWWVEVIDGGASVAAPGSNSDTSDAGYMAWHPVGPGCAKRNFRGFAVRQFDAFDAASYEQRLKEYLERLTGER